ncbi:MAG: response regulator transcription factor [Elusimicrobia bacterium]|jgi:DNA-binding response OmpR family regulator|nr:response regulator transcription factor [Elusimicrobiota bacterium]
MKVLVADDDNTFRMLVTELLSEAGYELSAHENGLLAWNALQAEGADLAVLDINMPEMDGIELLGRIRSDERFKNMPVLLLTIKAFTEDQVQGYERGADDYLTKPFDNDVLVARVKVLERRILGK